MNIFGWDASDYDWGRGPMNLVAAKNAGVSFFTYKATEGTSTKHAHYGEALNRALNAGIEFLGAYIVPRTAPTVAAQVDYFLAYVNSATPWWTSCPGFFFQVDTEKWSKNGVVYDAVSPQRGADVCAEIKRRTGRRVIHYAPNWAYGGSIPQPDPLWASSYGDNGVGTLQQKYPGDNSTRWNAYSGRTPTFLQFGSKVIIGTQNTCDGNAFRGSITDLRTFITGSSGSAGGDGDVIIMKKGDKGAVVTQWQKWGQSLGGSLPKFGPDGDYGDETAAMVRTLVGYGDGTTLSTGDICFVDINKGAVGPGAPGAPGAPGKPGDPGVKGDKGDAAVLPPGATLIVQMPQQ